MSPIRTFRILAGWLLGTVLATSAIASQSFVNQGLTVHKGGTLADWVLGQNIIFDDEFNRPPNFPAAPNFSNGTPAAYATGGSITQPGSGAIVMNPDAGVPVLGLPGKASFATLLTDVTSSAAYSALDKGSTFAVSTNFTSCDLCANYQVPAPLPNYAYGISLRDSFSDNNDIVQLTVVYSALGPELNFRQANAALNTSTLLESVLLNIPTATKESIGLFLYHDQINSNVIKAGYSFYSDDTGQVGPLHFLSNSGTLFSNENFTRVNIQAVVLPEPGTPALMMLGCLGLLAFGKGRTRPAMVV